MIAVNRLKHFRVRVRVRVPRSWVRKSRTFIH